MINAADQPLPGKAQYALLEELDCELGDGVLWGVSLASQP
jgi:hypothetical protein